MMELLAFIISLIITIICIFFEIFITFITLYEKQKTRTDYNISVIRKLSFSLFAISGLVNFFCELVFIENDKDNYTKVFGAGGIIFNQNYILIINCFMPLFTELLDIKGIMKRYLQRQQIKRVDLGLPVVLTQIELNRLFECPEFNIIKRYSQCLKTMYVVAFYSPIIPIAIIWGLFALIIQYWIDKYNLIKRRSVKYNMSKDLAREMTELLEYVLIIYCASNVIFHTLILQEYAGTS